MKTWKSVQKVSELEESPRSFISINFIDRLVNLCPGMNIAANEYYFSRVFWFILNTYLRYEQASEWWNLNQCRIMKLYAVMEIRSTEKQNTNPTINEYPMWNLQTCITIHLRFRADFQQQPQTSRHTWPPTLHILWLYIRFHQWELVVNLETIFII